MLGEVFIIKLLHFECWDLRRVIVSPPSVLVRACNKLRHTAPICARDEKRKLKRRRNLRGAPEGNERERERERDLFISGFPFSGSSLCLLCRVTGERERKKEEGIWFHPTLLPFQRGCSGSLVGAGGWGSVRFKPPLYTWNDHLSRYQPACRSAASTPGYINGWDAARFFFASNLENAQK